MVGAWVILRGVTGSARHYQVKAVLGKGGFGKVYVATLKTPDGFTKDVAIKVLRDLDPSSEALQRFRDEARLLGLIRDRSVVQVDPPTRLSGRWAVVMEYVDGASLFRILRKQKVVPPAVALSITRDLAGALDRLWNHLGPDGQPLHLRHRDIKPSNIQVRPDGSVVLLDFGIAKATFESREAMTTAAVMGSEGYMPPERYQGEDGPTTDVYSLGVVLFEMVMGSRPSAVLRAQPPTDDLRASALALAGQMMAQKPDDRPSAREVERQSSQLLVGVPQTTIREWARALVPSASRLADDELVGETLAEIAPEPSPPTDTTVRTAVVATSAALMSSLLVVGFLLLLGGIGVGGVLWARGSSSVAVAPEPQGAPAPADRSSSEEAAAASLGTGAREVPPGAVAAPPPPSPPPVASLPPPPSRSPANPPAPDPTPGPTPSPLPAPPDASRPPVDVASAAPRASEATVRVSFGSLPPDATVTVDGASIGITPVVGWTLSEGPHTVTLARAGLSITRTIHVDRRAPTRYLWRIEADVWEGSR